MIFFFILFHSTFIPYAQTGSFVAEARDLLFTSKEYDDSYRYFLMKTVWVKKNMPTADAGIFNVEKETGTVRLGKLVDREVDCSDTCNCRAKLWVSYFFFFFYRLFLLPLLLLLTIFFTIFSKLPFFSLNTDQSARQQSRSENGEGLRCEHP